MMNTFFWWSSKVSNLLFYGYNITTSAGLIATCFGLVALSFLFEWVKLMQARYRQKELFLRARQVRSICPSENSTLLGQSSNIEPIIITLKDRILLFIHEFFLWISLQYVGYMLMLVVMVYNGWFLIAVVIGGGVGYFVFGQAFMKINLQNCQIIRDTHCMLKCGEPGTEPEQNGESTPTAVVHEQCHEGPSVIVHASNS